MSDTYTHKVNEAAYEGAVYNVDDLRYSPDGNAYCRARMRLSKKFGEDWHSKFFDLTAFGSAAEELAECQDKDDVIVRGRMTLSKPYTKKDGTTVDADFAIVANEVERIGSFDPPAASKSTPVDTSDVPF